MDPVTPRTTVSTPPPAPLPRPAEPAPAPRPVADARPTEAPVAAQPAPALPPALQREHLRPPNPPLMTRDQMVALLNAAVSGAAPSRDGSVATAG